MTHARDLHRKARSRLAVALAGVSVLALAACERNAAERELPLLPATELAQLDEAPPVEALPAAQACEVRYVGGEGPRAYAYAERATALNYAFEEAPPDYGYAYDDTEVWGWESEDGYYRVVEPVEDYDRYYYYGPDD